MRALVLSDIHSNLEALAAVLEDADRRGGFDVTWCLGDFVGYGPDPSACVELVQQGALVAVAGNHDHGAAGIASVDDFNSSARAAIDWTHRQLSDGDRDFLAGLPLVVVREPFTLVHGSLRAPIVEYLLDQDSALATLERMSTQFCLVGHSHIPFICGESRGEPRFSEFTEDEAIPLVGERWIINPGCVGQPRDRDPRPSYAIFDDQQMTIQRHRVTYNIGETQAKMREAQLPDYLVQRLAKGE